MARARHDPMTFEVNDPEVTDLDVSVIPHPSARVLVLGGGAVVRECFGPALDAIGLSGRTTIVDPFVSSDAFPPPIQRVASDFSRFFDEAALDGLTHCVVALPNACHRDAVTRALQAGLHVLCEKPLTLKQHECEQLAALADRTRRVLAVNMVRRLFHSVEIAAHVLARGWLGELTSIDISHGGEYAWPVSSLAPFERENGGVLSDMGVHYLDLAEMFAGPLIPLTYQDDWAGGVESDCSFRLRSERGVRVDIRLSRLRSLENEVRLIGSAGRLRLGVDAFDRCVFEAHSLAAGRPLTIMGDGKQASTFTTYFAAQLRRFLASTVQSRQGLVDAFAAARTAAHIEWAYAQRRSSPTLSRRTARLEPGGVLVTGATGFIGSHLVARLAQDGSPITAAYHSLRSCARISRFPVRYHRTDLRDSAHVREAVRGQRFVFHLAYGRAEGEEQAITVDGTKHVIEACISEGVEAVVVLSSMYVLGRPDGMVDETAAYRPVGGAYGVSKAAMERWCLERAETAGATRIVVLLPTCVFGPGGGTYTQTPVEFAREGRFCWIADGRGLANVVYVENLVDCMLLAAVTPLAHGKRYLVSDDCLMWKEFLSPLLGPWQRSVPSPSEADFERLTTPPRGPGLREVAAAILRSQEVWSVLGRTSLVNALRPLIRKHVPSAATLRRQTPPATEEVRATPPKWLADVYGPNTAHVSSDRARRELGWVPAVSPEAAMDRTTAWLLEQGLYKETR